MRRLGLVIAAAALAMALAGAAGAQVDPDKYYSKTYNDCMSAAAGSTLPMLDCIHAEHDDWDKALNQIYQTLMASRSPAEKIQLRDDERKWLRTTTHKCAHAGDDEAGGTLQGIEIDQCTLDETLRRAVYLRGLH